MESYLRLHVRDTDTAPLPEMKKHNQASDLPRHAERIWAGRVAAALRIAVRRQMLEVVPVVHQRARNGGARVFRLPLGPGPVGPRAPVQPELSQVRVDAVQTRDLWTPM